MQHLQQSCTEDSQVRTDKNTTSRKDKHSVPSFISKAFEILEKQEHSEIVTWSDNGISFFVKDIKEFEEKILPVYFRHKNFASFVRQLNMYDFHKIRGEQKHIFEHKLFRRHQKHLLTEIKRKCFKKNRDDSDQDNADESKEERILETPKPKRASNILENLHMNAYLQLETTSKTRNQFEKEDSRSQIFAIIQEETALNSQRNKQLVNEIIGDLKNLGPKSDRQIRDKINELKKNPRYNRLRGKNYIYQIYRKVKQNLYTSRPKTTLEDLDELSIEQDMLYNQYEKPSKFKIVSLTNFQTQKLINKSQQEVIKYISGEDCSREFF